MSRHHPNASAHVIVPAVRHGRDPNSDGAVLQQALGQLWQAGVTIDWAAFHADERVRRVPLPTYPFERQRYWIDRATGDAPALALSVRARTPAESLYLPSWRASPPPEPEVEAGSRWLVFADSDGVADALSARLAAFGAETTMVRKGDTWTRLDAHQFIIDASLESGYVRMLEAVGVDAATPIHVVNLWSLDGTPASDSLVYTARALVAACPSSSAHVSLVTTHAVSVSGDEDIEPLAAMGAGICKVIPQEFPQLRTYHIDMLPNGNADTAAARLLAEICTTHRPIQVALRGRRRWVPHFQRCDVAVVGRHVNARGHSLITGGLGRIGLAIAEHLAAGGASAITLVARHVPDDATDERLKRIVAQGTRVLVLHADVANDVAMGTAFERAILELGRIDNVIHAAGKVRTAVKALADVSTVERAEHLHAKVAGTQVLSRLVDKHAVGFCVLMSSLSTVLGGLGLGAYAAANSYMDAFAHARHNKGDTRWVSVNWDGWLFNGEASRTSDDHGVSPAEGNAALDAIFQLPAYPQWVHSSLPLEPRMAQWLQPASLDRPVRAAHARPSVTTEFVAASTATERLLAAIWQDVLGIDVIGVRDNFFELGGDSVMLIQVHKSIRAQGHASVTVPHLFQYLAITDLASFIDAAKPDGGAASIINRRLDRHRGRTMAGSTSTTASET
jgi:acyl transferase domain-containing protein